MFDSEPVERREVFFGVVEHVCHLRFRSFERAGAIVELVAHVLGARLSEDGGTREATISWATLPDHREQCLSDIASPF